MAGLLRRSLGIEESLFEIRRAKSFKDIVPLLPEDVFRPPGFKSTLEDSLECWQRRLATVNVERSIETLDSLDGFLIDSTSPSWPKTLADLGDSAPPALWAIGRKDVIGNHKTLSVVGARIASGYGLQVTQDLVRLAVSRGMTIVSGGALGIDAEAHRSAITFGGKTIAIMAGGIDRLYPSKNLDLFEEIKHSGLIVSEMPPGTAPARWRFLQRNRLIAALGRATVVVEAGYRSGSINTAGHANELDRPVGAVPGPINSTRCAGCHRLIREKRAELISTPSDLLELLGLEETVHVSRMEGLSPLQIRALDTFGAFEQTLERVAMLAGITLNEARNALESLRNLGLVLQTSSGWLKYSNTL